MLVLFTMVCVHLWSFIEILTHHLLAKSAADFTSNKLEYLTDKLCKKYKKLSHLLGSLNVPLGGVS